MNCEGLGTQPPHANLPTKAIINTLDQLRSYTSAIAVGMCETNGQEGRFQVTENKPNLSLISCQTAPRFIFKVADQAIITHSKLRVIHIDKTRASHKNPSSGN